MCNVALLFLRKRITTAVCELNHNDIKQSVACILKASKTEMFNWLSNTEQVPYNGDEDSATHERRIKKEWLSSFVSYQISTPV